MILIGNGIGNGRVFPQAVTHAGDLGDLGDYLCQGSLESGVGTMFVLNVKCKISGTGNWNCKRRVCRDHCQFYLVRTQSESESLE